MFFVGEVVKPSGTGRTATWEGMVGTVVFVEGTSVFVQWHNVAVEDEMSVEELVSTGTFQKRVPHHVREKRAVGRTRMLFVVGLQSPAV